MAAKLRCGTSGRIGRRALAGTQFARLLELTGGGDNRPIQPLNDRRIRLLGG